MVPKFEAVTAVAAPPEQVFAVCLDVQAHTRSMASSSERAVDGSTRGELSLGDTVAIQARHFGPTWRLKARIATYDRPRRFVDEQESGPFKRWHHAHHFEPDGAGGTVMRDVVDFASPLGPVGRIVDGILLGRYMPHLISPQRLPGRRFRLRKHPTSNSPARSPALRFHHYAANWRYA
ncbi:SRPBCC family protein [Streptomyces lydicus]|uniref:SRPBCC family protein n=1 Tax=Streptomyces lydicus TaxID=47763 RepID=UPI0036931BA3